MNKYVILLMVMVLILVGQSQAKQPQFDNNKIQENADCWPKTVKMVENYSESSRVYSDGRKEPIIALSVGTVVKVVGVMSDSLLVLDGKKQFNVQINKTDFLTRFGKALAEKEKKSKENAKSDSGNKTSSEPVNKPVETPPPAPSASHNEDPGLLKMAADAEQDHDYKLAVQYYREAVEAGSQKGAFHLARLLYQGKGVERNLVEAAALNQKCADQGVASAYNNLALSWLEQSPKEFNIVLDSLRKAETLKVPEASYNLGMIFLEGRGVPKNQSEGLESLKRAASLGFAPAQYQMGRIYAESLGVIQDYTEALRWFEEAADQNHMPALLRLGNLYREGRAVEKDYKKALGYYKKAADQGDPEALNRIGMMYCNSQGVVQDMEVARKCLEEAANMGYAEAQFNLGLLFTLEASKDLPQAYRWFLIAGKNGSKQADGKAAEIKSQLKEAEWQEAEKTASAFKSKPASLKTGENQWAYIVSPDGTPKPTDSFPKSPLKVLSKNDKTAPNLSSRLSTMVQESLVIVSAGEATGSGFIVEMEGKQYVVTNCHVISGARDVSLKMLNGRILKTVTLELADKSDLARISFSSDEPVKALTIVPTAPVMYEPISVMGNSDGAGVVTELSGKVLAVGPDNVEVDSPFVRGNSGSPVLNQEGQVMAVASFVSRVKPDQDWVKKGTRFEEARRFAIRLNIAHQWKPVEWEDFYRQTIMQHDIEALILDLARILPAWINTPERKQAIDYLMTYSETSGDYADPKWAAKIAALGKAYKTMVQNQSAKKTSSFDQSWYVMKRNESFDFFVNEPRKDLKKMKWSTEYLKKQADDYTEVFNQLDTYFKDIKKDLMTH